MHISSLFQKSWRTIISPQQLRHHKHMLGSQERVCADGRTIVRQDITFTNNRNKKIEGFLFYEPGQSRDLVVYLHGNGGSKLDAMPLVDQVGRIAIAAFDFASCGNSQHDYLTYGIREAEDVRIFLEELKMFIRPSSTTIWGRSMGAATAIMFASRYPDKISGLVLDSPFRRLEQVVQRTARQTQPNLPFLDLLIYLLKWKVDNELMLPVSLFSIDYLQQFQKISNNVALLLIYSSFDNLVPKKEVFQFFGSFSGDHKETMEIFQQHNQQRHADMFHEAFKWLLRQFDDKEKEDYGDWVKQRLFSDIGEEGSLSEGRSTMYSQRLNISLL